MMREERLLNVIVAPHVSEKSTMTAEDNNTVVFKVAVDATKAEIKAAVEKLFEVEVKNVRTVNVKVKPSVPVSVSENVATGKKRMLP